MATMTVSASGLDAIVDHFKAEPEQVRLGLKRAIKRTATHAASEIRKGMAATVGAKPSAVKKRVTSRMLRDEGLVWIGLNPLLPVHLAGGVSQQPDGVRAGQKFYRGAFLKEVYGGGKKVWIRLKSRHYDAETYPYKPRSAGSVPHALRHRFPVVLARVPVDTEAVRAMYHGQVAEIGPYLADLVRRELDYRTRSRV